MTGHTNVKMKFVAVLTFLSLMLLGSDDMTSYAASLSVLDEDGNSVESPPRGVCTRTLSSEDLVETLMLQMLAASKQAATFVRKTVNSEFFFNDRVWKK